MRILHLALQGCLRRSVVFGQTADTGGHIRYLFDLVEALSRTRDVTGQTIVTRGFDEPHLGPTFAAPREAFGRNVTIARVFGRHSGYLSKEDLHKDIPALTESFLAYLAAELVRPDLIHAHYADAGTLAEAAKQTYGIPYVFTAHSLGRVKRAVLSADRARLKPDAGNALTRREAVEDQAIAGADLIVASSRDEAEYQFGLYPSARPDRIRVNPPGCDAAAFRSVDRATLARVADRIDRELDDPLKPMILAIARPVERKNLVGLAAAFGGDAELKRCANLVIVAGSAHVGDGLSDENRSVLSALYDQADGLRGRMALPDHHTADEVPAFYALARARGGVFANPAIHEPFGLTLIEAAAAGLPVVATRHGGPCDIVAAIKHGILTDPRDPAAIARTLRAVLTDANRYEALSAAARSNASAYTWGRHAALYVRDAKRLLTPPAAPILQRRTAPPDGLVLVDIDNTLVGNRPALARFLKWRSDHANVAFGVATGRSLHDAIAILARERVPAPDVMVTSVGSEIYYPTDDDYSVRCDAAWQDLMAEDWDPAAIEDLLAERAELTPQPPLEQRAFKRSWFGRLDAAGVTAVADALSEAGLAANVIYSHGQFLDVLPRSASKGRALAYLRDRLGLPDWATAAAGDSGNDTDMLQAAGRGIVVANHTAELEPLRAVRSVRFSAAAYAGGIVEALAGWPPTHRTAGTAPPVGASPRTPSGRWS